jgi:hypothetical protein
VDQHEVGEVSALKLDRYPAPPGGKLHRPPVVLRRDQQRVTAASAEREDEPLGRLADQLASPRSLVAPEEHELKRFRRVRAVKETREAHALGLPPAF